MKTHRTSAILKGKPAFLISGIKKKMGHGWYTKWLSKQIIIEYDNVKSSLDFEIAQLNEINKEALKWQEKLKHQRKIVKKMKELV